MKKYNIKQVVKIIKGNNKRKFIGEWVDNKNFVIYGKSQKIFIVFINEEGVMIYDYLIGEAEIKFKEKEFKEYYGQSKVF